MEYIPLPEKPVEPVKTDRDRLLEAVTLGVDISPLDLVKDEVGCSESVSNLLKKVFPDFPIIVSTYDLYIYLKRSPKFKPLLAPKKGCIVVSPRTATTNGHTGVFVTDIDIGSNDSLTGLFKKNYTWPKWITEFRDKRGLRTYLFELV